MSNNISNNVFKEIAGWIKDNNAVIFSGAGMSTASGIPDFRSTYGLWYQFNPMEIATIKAYRYNYEQFRDFYRMRIKNFENITPNLGHNVLVKWEDKGFIKGIITQNVDGLHKKAGSKNVAELHGKLDDIICGICFTNHSLSSFFLDTKCNNCTGTLRPNVVLFGEQLPESSLNQAEKWSLDCKVFIVLGSSLVVSPANLFPEMAKDNGAKLIICNREETCLDKIADIAVHDEIDIFLHRIDYFL